MPHWNSVKFCAEERCFGIDRVVEIVQRVVVRV